MSAAVNAAAPMRHRSTNPQQPKRSRYTDEAMSSRAPAKCPSTRASTGGAAGCGGCDRALVWNAGALGNGGVPVVVHLNRYDATDDLHHRNRDWLADRDRFDVVISVGELVHRLLERSGGR